MNMALNMLNKVEINVGFNDIVYLYCNLSMYLFNFNLTIYFSIYWINLLIFKCMNFHLDLRIYLSNQYASLCKH